MRVLSRRGSAPKQKGHSCLCQVSAEGRGRPQSGATDDDLIKGGGERWRDLQVDQRACSLVKLSGAPCQDCGIFVLGNERSGLVGPCDAYTNVKGWKMAYSRQCISTLRLRDCKAYFLYIHTYIYILHIHGLTTAHSFHLYNAILLQWLFGWLKVQAF